MLLTPQYQYWEKVYFESQILVYEYWTILDHFGVAVLFASGCYRHVLKNVNITFLGNTGTPNNVPVFTNTGTFQYLGPEVHFFLIRKSILLQFPLFLQF